LVSADFISVEQRRQLGATDLYLSPIGLGTVKFGRTTGLNYPNEFTLPNESTLDKLLYLAESLGINLLDTAPAYGVSEQRLGSLLASRKDKFIVSTKVGEYHINGQSHYDFSAKSTRTSIENSLKALRRSELDLVMVHSDGADADIITKSDVLQTLQQYKEKGLVRYIGFSGKTVAGSLLAIEQVDAFMVTLNRQDSSQLELLKIAKDRNKGILIKKAFASGHAANNDALDYVVNYPGVTSAIVGTINPEHLRANVSALTL
jgi:aryl-alcohol dehydrogenase-like predicted oxidoreductase